MLIILEIIAVVVRRAKEARGMAEDVGCKNSAVRREGKKVLIDSLRELFSTSLLISLMRAEQHGTDSRLITE